MAIKIVSFLCLLCTLIPWGRADTAADAMAAAKKAVRFLTEEVSTEGGYLWRYSADLALREGEGIVTTQTVWTQPPGTPTMGEAFLDLYAATGDQQFLAAARQVGEALRKGQMLSGGWQASIEFEPQRRVKWAYRTHAKQPRKAKDQSSLDDDKSQSAMRFVVRLDKALEFQDEAVHDMAVFALNGLIEHGQFANGGFPQVYSRMLKGSLPDEIDPNAPASFPESWSRKYEGHQNYWYRPTLNDNLAPDVFATLMLAHRVYSEERYREAAIKLADFLLLAQLPEPQPAWAQQYSYAMQPIWARKFEPAAITGGESQGVIRTLLDIYLCTGEQKYLKPIPRALDYLERSQVPDGRLARFYELGSNRPLYFTKDYQLTYDDSDMPTHYGFQVASSVAKLRAKYKEVSALTQTQLEKRREASRRPKRRVREKEVVAIMQSIDERGAWVSTEGLRYHKRPGAVIDMLRTTESLSTLAAFLAD
ncbi:MAG: pectic acid lyase [Planctomycetota bacterium]|nr:pectic acid lyase [Planctomycetota bacterium]